MSKKISNFDSIEKNIDFAVELCQKKYSEDEIINILYGYDDIQKCIAIMNIDAIKTQEVANLLISHLTNQGGTVREAVAIKLELLFNNENNIKFFQSDYIVNTICDAIIDINPNISRLILTLINKIQNQELILKNISEKIKKYLDNILQSDVLQNHQINKFYFKIYWLLEALYVLNNIDIKPFEPLLDKISNLPEYTVREKTALIVNKYAVLRKLKDKLANDNNYYVKRVFS